MTRVTGRRSALSVKIAASGINPLTTSVFALIASSTAAYTLSIDSVSVNTQIFLPIG